MCISIYFCVSISLMLNSFYNTALSDKKSIAIEFVISNSAWEPISVSTLIWGNGALAVTTAAYYILRQSWGAIKSAAT